jgi:uncharacterized protein YcbK (DUF882 family)
MKNFKREEFACQCGCGFDTVDYELANVLDELRDYFANPVTINSGSRCAVHNKAVGGSLKSQHVYGRAADVVVKNVHADLVYKYLEDKYPSKFGIGQYIGRTHIDTRSGSKARWDSRK